LLGWARTSSLRRVVMLDSAVDMRPDSPETLETSGVMRVSPHGRPPSREKCRPVICLKWPAAPWPGKPTYLESKMLTKTTKKQNDSSKCQ
jgi:hypothetical protein